jgi:NAD(P)-dependent dehydrogenase (short-subunit alcohol dehydrogenase family)
MPSIFITGANRGLGLAFARHYAAAGWQVIASCRTPTAATALNALAVEVVWLDVTDFAAIEALGQTLAARPLDLLLNNAGSYAGEQPFGRIDVAAWQQVLRVNCLAPIMLAQALLPSLLAGSRKQMVFLTSRMGSVSDNSGGGSYLYRSSKAALNAAVKSLSIDLAPQGISALLFHPGWVKTDMGTSRATVAIEDSIRGMTGLIERARPGQALTFQDYQGRPLPW